MICMCKPFLKKILTVLLLFLFVFIYQEQVADAAEEIMGYENPHDIIIAAPANKYTTTASKVSILGACDYEYPLYLNDQLITTTEHGFFTVYADLDIGENQFLFENNGKFYTHTIIRKKALSSNGNSSGTTTPQKSNSSSYKAYNYDAYGVVTGKYVMPRTQVKSADINHMPLTRGTSFKILGEEKGYYKISDGSYVAKSSVTLHKKKLQVNKVSKTKMVYEKESNQIITELEMNVNTLYEVYFEGQDVYLILYGTVDAKEIQVPSNDLISKVTYKVDKKSKTVTYRFECYNEDLILGYDVLFNQGIMKFEIKIPPKLHEIGSLQGVTVFLDAGHGKHDSGALGPLGKYGPMEKDINLNITLYAKEYLEQLGAKVVLSREDDNFLSLSDRVSKIRNLRPDIAVSIHGNSLDHSSDYGKTSGFLTYYTYAIGGDLPHRLNESITSALDFNIRSPRQSNLSMTRLTTCPSALLETMFLSNPWDYEYLIKNQNQKDFGYAIGKAIQDYFEAIAIQDNVSYIVKKGDSLSRIAVKFNVTVEQIVKYNQIKNKNNIYVGQELIIPQ